jgi:hypothetical protein
MEGARFLVPGKLFVGLAHLIPEPERRWGGLAEQIQLIADAKGGSREAFLDLVKPLEDKLYQTALGIVGNRHDAEDIWQSTVLKA